MFPRSWIVLLTAAFVVLVICAAVYSIINVSLLIKRHRLMKELTSNGCFLYNFDGVENRFNKDMSFPNAVDFKSMKVSKGLTALVSKLNNFQVVNFDDCDFEPGALSEIGQSECPLNWMAFRGNRLTEIALASLPSLPELKTLIIRDARFSDDCLDLIADRCPNLTTLRIFYAELSEDAADSICRLNELKELKLFCRDLDGKVFLKILKSVRIEELSVPTSLITSEFMREIEEDSRITNVTITEGIYRFSFLLSIEEPMPTVNLKIEYVQP